jgi:uncharacterized protein with von Willebrand factor type A (vWA) domain
MNASPDSLALPPVACSRAARSAARERVRQTQIYTRRESRFKKREKMRRADRHRSMVQKCRTGVHTKCIFYLCVFFPLKAKGSSEKK